jgi:cation/acetate symporter
MNLTAVAAFLPTIAITLIITAWAARRTQSKADYYSAGGRVSGFQNGIAIAGDLLSASTFLGLTGMFFASGVDMSSIYYVTPPVAMCLLLALVAGPLRRAGRYTLGDVLTTRGEKASLRAFSGVSTITICILFLVGQMVGAGTLISNLFGVSFGVSVVVIATLMTIYVTVGGMLAATWVQIIKAGLLIAIVILMALLCIIEAGGLGAIYERAAKVHPLGDGLFLPGASGMDLFSAASLALATTVGSLGLPHLLIRFFTVPDARAAEQSVAVATTAIIVVSVLLFAIISPAAIALLSGVPEFTAADGGMAGGVNMTSINLATALGGEPLMGITAAIAFATILAVVAGVVMAAASAASHDVLSSFFPAIKQSEKWEINIFRIGAVVVSIIAVLLAFAFQHENVAFLIGLAMAVALSANVPVILLTLYWPRLTQQGSLVAGYFGLITSVVLIILGPSVWVKLLGNAEPIFPSDYPGLLVAPITVLIAVLVSLWGPASNPSDTALSQDAA